MVRLKDIAAVAGVSVMTVSKALRDKPDLSVGTKLRIQALAQQMGYVPDASASGLRNRKTRLLGLVIPAPTDPVYSRVLLALESMAYERGFDLLLAHSLGQVDREDSVIRRFMSRRVDGIFIAPVYRMESTAPIFEDLLKQGIPTVLLGQRAPFCQQFVNVETDDLGASEAVTRHLISLGHRRIAFFAGPTHSPWAQERIEGYRRGLRDAGIPVEDRLVFHAGSTLEEGASAALQYIQENPEATAIQGPRSHSDPRCERLGSHRGRGYLAQPRSPHSSGPECGWVWQCFGQRILSRTADDRSPTQASLRFGGHGTDAQTAGG
jgi:LacI family transcriptional regulator